MGSDPIVKCSACRGGRVVKCVACAGEGVVAGALGAAICPACAGEKIAVCRACNGTGLRPRVKVCRCGATFDVNAWNALPYVGLQDDGEGGFLELRNCDRCWSTIAVVAKAVA